MQTRHAMFTIALTCAITLGCSAAPPATQPAATQPDGDALAQQPAQTIARAYGIEHWDQIERLDFRFMAQSPGRDSPTSNRQWSWWPREGKVTLTRAGEEPIEVPLVPGTTNLPVGDRYPEQVVRTHRRFINDSYWFLIPFHIAWSNPKVTDGGMVSLPMGEGKARKIVAQYPDEGGYTPGDAYDLYVDPQTHRVRQWVFRRDGQADGPAMTWEKHRRLGPIVVCTDHWGAPNENGNRFHLWVTDIRAKLAGEDEWIEARPLEP